MNDPETLVAAHLRAELAQIRGQLEEINAEAQGADPISRRIARSFINEVNNIYNDLAMRFQANRRLGVQELMQLQSEIERAARTVEEINFAMHATNPVLRTGVAQLQSNANNEFNALDQDFRNRLSMLRSTLALEQAEQAAAQRTTELGVATPTARYLSGGKRSRQEYEGAAGMFEAAGGFDELPDETLHELRQALVDKRREEPSETLRDKLSARISEIDQVLANRFLKSFNHSSAYRAGGTFDASRHRQRLARSSLEPPRRRLRRARSSADGEFDRPLTDEEIAIQRRWIENRRAYLQDLLDRTMPVRDRDAIINTMFLLGRQADALANLAMHRYFDARTQ